MLPFVEQASANDAAGGKDHTQRHQDIGPVELDRITVRIRERRQRLYGCALEDGHIAGLIQGDPADSTAVIGGDRVAGHIAAGGAAGVGGHRRKAVSHGVSVRIGGIVRLPADVLESQGAAIVLDGLGDVGGILAGQIGVAPGGRHLPGRAPVPGHFHLDGVQLEGQHTGETVLGDKLFFLGEQGQHGLHVLALALQRDGLCVLTALVLRQFLPEQINEGIMESILLEIRPGNAGGVLLRPQVIILADLCAILIPGHGGGVADLRGRR